MVQEEMEGGEREEGYGTFGDEEGAEGEVEGLERREEEMRAERAT